MPTTRGPWRGCGFGSILLYIYFLLLGNRPYFMGLECKKEMVQQGFLMINWRYFIVLFVCGVVPTQDRVTEGSFTF